MADVTQSVAGPTTRKVQDGARHPRLARELKTIRAMLRIYCRDHHGTGTSDAMCVECTALLHYATRRLDRCVFGDDKPTCANCKVHCYSKTMRERVREVMRYAGPRMLWRHPLLAACASARRTLPGARPAGAVSGSVPCRAGAPSGLDCGRTLTLGRAGGKRHGGVRPCGARGHEIRRGLDPRQRADGVSRDTGGEFVLQHVLVAPEAATVCLDWQGGSK